MSRNETIEPFPTDLVDNLWSAVSDDSAVLRLVVPPQFDPAERLAVLYELVQASVRVPEDADSSDFYREPSWALKDNIVESIDETVVARLLGNSKKIEMCSDVAAVAVAAVSTSAIVDRSAGGQRVSGALLDPSLVLSCPFATGVRCEPFNVWPSVPGETVLGLVGRFGSVRTYARRVPRLERIKFGDPDGLGDLSRARKHVLRASVWWCAEVGSVDGFARIVDEQPVC